MLRCLFISVFLITLLQSSSYCQSECLENFLKSDSQLLEPGRDSMLVYLTKVKNKKPRKKIHLLTIRYDSLTRTETMQYEDTRFASWPQYQRIRTFDQNNRVLSEIWYSKRYFQEGKHRRNFYGLNYRYGPDGLLQQSEETRAICYLRDSTHLDTVQNCIRTYFYSDGNEIKQSISYYEKESGKSTLTHTTQTTIYEKDGKDNLYRTTIKNDPFLRNTTYHYAGDQCVFRVDSAMQFLSGNVTQFKETDRFHFCYRNDSLIGVDHIHHAYEPFNHRKITTLKEVKYKSDNLASRTEEIYTAWKKRNMTDIFRGEQSILYHYDENRLISITSGHYPIEKTNYIRNSPNKITVYSRKQAFDESLWIDFE